MEALFHRTVHLEGCGVSFPTAKIDDPYGHDFAYAPDGLEGAGKAF